MAHWDRACGCGTGSGYVPISCTITHTHTHTPHTRYVPIGDYVVGVVHDTTKGGHSIIGAVGGVQFKQAPPIHALVRAGALPAVVGHVEV
jgi:hypothetical protein